MCGEHRLQVEKAQVVIGCGVLAVRQPHAPRDQPVVDRDPPQRGKQVDGGERRVDQEGQIEPKNYSKVLGWMIGAFILVFLVAVINVIAF